MRTVSTRARQVKPRAKLDTSNLVLLNQQAPGDILMMSAAVRDLHRRYPGRFKTMVRTTAGAIWENNPYVLRSEPPNSKVVKVGYSRLVNQSNQCGLHFIQGFVDDFNLKLNLDIKLTDFRPDVNWSELERTQKLVTGDYWVIVSGGKADFVTKWWGVNNYQRVVDMLKGEISFVQLGGNKNTAGGAEHTHLPLTDVINLVGETDLRQAFRICLHAQGILCPMTCFMHLAAAINKPCVVVAGAREHWTWEAYTKETRQRNMAYAAGLVPTPNNYKPEMWEGLPEAPADGYVYHQFLHTIGSLPCCQQRGCWKAKMTDPNPRRNCVDQVMHEGTLLPRCMAMITPEMVVEAIRSYNTRLVEMPIVQPYDRPKPKEVAKPTLRAPLGLAGIVRTSPRLQTVRRPQSIKPVEAYPVPPIGAVPPNVKLDALRRFDHVELPVTVCVLFYGDYSKLAHRMLTALYANTDPACFRLRIGLNAASAATRAFIGKFLETAPNVDKVYDNGARNLYKLPVMRAMFHDAEHPITTKWVLWFDDDSYVTNPRWLPELCDTISKQHARVSEHDPRGIHMFGKIYLFKYVGQQLEWIKRASWYTGRPFRVDGATRKPYSKFPVGGFWVISNEAIKVCDWPDIRLEHRGDDYMLGEAMYQQGFGVHPQCQWVVINDAQRRGDYNKADSGINDA